MLDQRSLELAKLISTLHCQIIAEQHRAKYIAISGITSDQDSTWYLKTACQ